MKEIILITGCSSGLGKNLLLHFSEEFIVYAGVRKEKDLEDIKKENIIPIILDVTKKESISKVFNLISSKHQKLDVLINNAGIGCIGFFEDQSEQIFRDIIEVNLFGVANMIRIFIPLLRKSQKAKIINISSTNGLMAMPTMSTYGASKWAIEGFSESLRFELASQKIQVLLVEAPLFKSEIFQKNLKYFENPESPYFNWSKQMKAKHIQAQEKIGLNPEQVSKVIIKIIRKNNPRFRTLISNLAKLRLFIKRIIPFSFYEKMIKSFTEEKLN